jgi:hypothetical protein
MAVRKAMAVMIAMAELTTTAVPTAMMAPKAMVAAQDADPAVAIAPVAGTAMGIMALKEKTCHSLSGICQVCMRALDVQ